MEIVAAGTGTGAMETETGETGTGAAIAGKEAIAGIEATVETAAIPIRADAPGVTMAPIQMTVAALPGVLRRC